MFLMNDYQSMILQVLMQFSYLKYYWFLSQRPLIGQEVFIPANAIHTVRNVGNTNNVWYYGYRSQR